MPRRKCGFRYAVAFAMHLRYSKLIFCWIYREPEFRGEGCNSGASRPTSREPFAQEVGAIKSIFLHHHTILVQQINQFFLHTVPLIIQTRFSTIQMARINTLPKTVLIRDLPLPDRVDLALQWLRDTPNETPSTAARVHSIQNTRLIQQALRREKKRGVGRVEIKKGAPTLLRVDEEQALIQYAIDMAVGMGATKKMMLLAINYLRRQRGEKEPSHRWF